MTLRSAVLAFLLLAAVPACADPIVGVASVVDADTIEIHGERIRIFGVDAPESYQRCLDAAGKEYRCGQRAALALDGFLRTHRPVSCVAVGDSWDRIVARCTAGGQDVAEWLARNGLALDWPRYSDGAYAGAEKAARAAKRGIWAGSFARPWERRRDRDAALISAGN